MVIRRSILGSLAFSRKLRILRGSNRMWCYLLEAAIWFHQPALILRSDLKGVDSHYPHTPVANSSIRATAHFPL